MATYPDGTGYSYPAYGYGYGTGYSYPAYGYGYGIGTGRNLYATAHAASSARLARRLLICLGFGAIKAGLWCRQCAAPLESRRFVLAVLARQKRHIASISCLTSIAAFRAPWRSVRDCCCTA